MKKLILFAAISALVAGSAVSTGCSGKSAEAKRLEEEIEKGDRARDSIGKAYDRQQVVGAARK